MRDWKIAPQFLSFAKVKMLSWIWKRKEICTQVKDRKSSAEVLVLVSWCAHSVQWGVYLCSHPPCWAPTSSWRTPAELVESVFGFNFPCNEFIFWHFETDVQLSGIAAKFTAERRHWWSRGLQETLETWKGANSLASCSAPVVDSQFPEHVACCWEGGNLNPSAIHSGNLCIIVIKGGGLLGSCP